MKAFLYLFYHSVRLLALTIFRLFYGKKTILNQKNLKVDYPCILVSNHPNTLHDPLHVAAKVDHRIVHFLVNAGLFATPFTNWFFSTFYCIKIERPQDVKGGKISNEKAFEACDIFLRQGGCLYIAPEGTSRVERHIRKMKTGAARIALSAERHNNYQLGLKILPVGLNYDNPTKFRR
ncbi:MAG: 1-acyl-sn-glycerol-3-phosphate acyltransferase, partial [Saprospiraceae bacterium]